MKKKAELIFRRFGRERRGVIAVVVALSMFMLFGVIAISVDAGYLLYAQNDLQASANMAALAGAKNFTSGDASSVALSYSAQPGSLNAPSWGNVTVTVALRCLNTVANLPTYAVPCTSYGSQPIANSVQVTQTATVPTFFGRVLGIQSVTLTAMATAVPQGSTPQPLNVVFVLDTSGSMNSDDTACLGTGEVVPTRLECALHGVQTLLVRLVPSIDQVSLLIFPGLTDSGQVPKEYDCLSTPEPSIAAYNANPVYTIITSSTDYRTGSPLSSDLDTGSNLSKAVGAGPSGCEPLSAVGGVGTYFADSITAAQTLLEATHQEGQQNVIVFLGDGDAGASSSKVGADKYDNQCQQAVTAAQAAASAGTWVYSIAYGASTNEHSSCDTDGKHFSACDAMQGIASDVSKFFSDKPTSCLSVNSQSQLEDIFGTIGNSLSGARLIPNDTT